MPRRTRLNWYVRLFRYHLAQVRSECSPHLIADYRENDLRGFTTPAREHISQRDPDNSERANIKRIIARQPKCDGYLFLSRVPGLRHGKRGNQHRDYEGARQSQSMNATAPPSAPWMACEIPTSRNHHAMPATSADDISANLILRKCILDFRANFGGQWELHPASPIFGIDRASFEALLVTISDMSAVTGRNALEEASHQWSSLTLRYKPVRFALRPCCQYRANIPRITFGHFRDGWRGQHWTGNFQKIKRAKQTIANDTWLPPLLLAAPSNPAVDASKLKDKTWHLHRQKKLLKLPIKVGLLPVQATLLVPHLHSDPPLHRWIALRQPLFTVPCGNGTSTLPLSLPRSPRG